MQNLRAKNKYVHTEIRNTIKRLRDECSDVSEPGPSKHLETEGRCHLCPDSKTQYFCGKYIKYLYLKKHSNFVCNNCI